SRCSSRWAPPMRWTRRTSCTTRSRWAACRCARSRWARSRRPARAVAPVRMLSGMGRIRVGTSGYPYRHWRGLLYPGALPAGQWLQRYASLFDTCELNATFYRLPTARAVDGWRERTPPGFLFACKGSRYLTHLKRLTDAGEGVRRYFALARRLGRKLGP